MQVFRSVDSETVLAGTGEWLDDAAWKELSRHPLACIETEYPHYQYSVESETVTQPSERHPIFYGCFDWHSAVHSHWCLVRQLRVFPSHPQRSKIIQSIDPRLTTEAVEREVAYFADHQSFENPYGWGWFLRLAAELALCDDETIEGWRGTLAPLESHIVSLVTEEFLTLDRPFRVGTHGNTAFSLCAVLDYARVTDNDSLTAAAESTAREHFLADRSYPVAYEPLGWDFLSPAITEADLMRRVLPHDELVDWFDQFMPDNDQTAISALLDPEPVDPDTESGMELHLAGLALAKAWCLIGLAETLPDHRLSDRFAESARHHVETGIEAVFTESYAGSHWLVSFFLYLITRREGGIALTSEEGS